MDVTNTSDLVTRILAGAIFARDFCAVRNLVNPKSKLRLALERQAPKLIEREIPRVLLDPDALTETDRAEYERGLASIREKYGDQIETSPFELPRSLVEDIAERAMATGSFASASDALEFLGTRNQRIGDLVASALRDLKSAGDTDDPDSANARRSATDAVWLAAKLKNPLEPLFQKRATDFHFSGREAREKFYQALVSGKDRETADLCIHYLLGDREISESVCRALSGNTGRKSFLNELARILSGGNEKYSEFIDRYQRSVEILRSSSGEKPDPAGVQEVQAALSGDESYKGDGAGLLRQLATSHPIAALVCRLIVVPRKGPHLIPIVFEGTSALQVLGLRSD
ncbi:MAG: hypothetical protein KAW17_07560 [Candidatus Eisenbacteria sp.]|nr:hypothetical protein [Candidatus Eisenbacteria bacterium]